MMCLKDPSFTKAWVLTTVTGSLLGESPLLCYILDFMRPDTSIFDFYTVQEAILTLGFIWFLLEFSIFVTTFWWWSLRWGWVTLLKYLKIWRSQSTAEIVEVATVWVIKGSWEDSHMPTANLEEVTLSFASLMLCHCSCWIQNIALRTGTTNWRKHQNTFFMHKSEWHLRHQNSL